MTSHVNQFENLVEIKEDMKIPFTNKFLKSGERVDIVGFCKDYGYVKIRKMNDDVWDLNFKKLLGNCIII